MYFVFGRDQMKLQLSKTGFGVRERDFFFKSGFDSFERICRTNFDILIDADPQSGISFHTDALTANAANPDTDTDNIRIMIMTKALIGTCSTEPAGAGGGMQVAVCNKTGLPIDTITNLSGTVFTKFSSTDLYPSHLLVYRDTSLPLASDSRSTQLKPSFVQLSYRSGTRFNPQEKGIPNYYVFSKDSCTFSFKLREGAQSSVFLRIFYHLWQAAQELQCQSEFVKKQR